MRLKTEFRDIIYLDNAATTFPKPETVYAAMDDFYRHFGGNAGRGANPLARLGTQLVEETRSMVSSWLNAPATVFTPSATYALNTVILGARLHPGDTVYVTPFEHNSVLRPLEHLRQTIGIEIKTLPFDRQSFECRLETVRQSFQIEPPSMVCVTMTSNVFGVCPPVHAILEMARKTNRNVVTLVDGAQSAGLKPVDMTQVDALVWSGHKALYGPYGIAGIAFGGEWRPEPLVHGGTGTQSESVQTPIEGAARFEAGSHNLQALAGIHAALEWLNATSRDAINTQIEELVAELRNTVTALPVVRLYNGSTATGIISFEVDGIAPQSLETALGARNIAVRAGLHCAPWAHELADTIRRGGTVRMSVGYFNTSDDIKKLGQVLDAILAEEIM